MVLHPILDELLKSDIDVSIKLRDGDYIVIINGFYKAGQITLKFHSDGTIKAYSRYERVDTINSFDDLVFLNFDWLYSSRGYGWMYPDREWEPHFKRLNLKIVT